MEDQKVQVVSSYVRYKKETPVKQNDVLIPAVMLASITALVAVLLWQVSLSLIAAGAITYKAHTAYKARQELRANGLPVKYWNGKRVWL